MGDVLLKMRNIDKIFPGVKALSNVDFTLRAGEIHSLMGCLLYTSDAADEQ